MSKQKIPSIIYLQCHGEIDEKPIGDYYEGEEVTWCENKINDWDEQYFSKRLLDKLLPIYPNLYKDLKEIQK